MNPSTVSSASILIMDGNRAATRAQQIAAGGQASGEGYAQVLQALAPVSCDIVRPADEAAPAPRAGGWDAYDGVAMTGSALNVYDGGQHIGGRLSWRGRCSPQASRFSAAAGACRWRLPRRVAGCAAIHAGANLDLRAASS